MTAQEFCYWLQGFFELSGAKELTAAQVAIIENHLNLVDVTTHGVPVAPSNTVPANSTGQVLLRC